MPEANRGKIAGQGGEMQQSVAIKQFEVEEGGVRTERGILGYKITVKFRGVVVEEFERNTMMEAQAAFKAAGYQEVRK